jgi:beta-lactamase regulating signal transducer with metallopeptidase domain
VTAIASGWAVHLAHALWPGTIAAAVILLIVRLFRGTSPKLRHALVTIALLKFIIPPMLPLPVGLFSAAPPAPEIRTVANVVHGIDGRILVVLMLIHMAGTAFMFTRMAAAFLRLRRIRLEAEDAGEFLISDAIDVPVTTGRAILTPRKLLDTLSADELRDVLAHEREHIRRRDVLRGMFDRFIVALWWFHPLVHVLASEARTLREEACDDALIASGRCAPAHYARTLLRAATFAAGSTSEAAAAVAESPHALLRRVRRMAARGFAPTARLGLAATLAVIIAAVLLLPGLRISRGNRIAFDHATRHALHHGH